MMEDLEIWFTSHKYFVIKFILLGIGTGISGANLGQQANYGYSISDYSVLIPLATIFFFFSCGLFKLLFIDK